ncbi:hypothetical protein BZA70DRAFT_160023 [Myxozyma melibiosi]|uniref:Uncharacterized protein n=1 Tax=Myxozyma melibiosi TaxID=54550 RepID=A0ABR1F8Q9_9ASCO
MGSILASPLSSQNIKPSFFSFTSSRLSHAMTPGTTMRLYQRAPADFVSLDVGTTVATGIAGTTATQSAATFTPSVVQSSSYVSPSISGSSGFPKGVIVVFALFAVAFATFGYFLIRSGIRRQQDQTWAEQKADAKRQWNDLAERIISYRKNKRGSELEETVSEIEARERLFGYSPAPKQESEGSDESDGESYEESQVREPSDYKYSYSIEDLQRLEQARKELERLRRIREIEERSSAQYDRRNTMHTETDSLPLIARSGSPSKHKHKSRRSRRSRTSTASTFRTPLSVLEMELMANREASKREQKYTVLTPPPLMHTHEGGVYYREDSPSPTRQSKSSSDLESRTTDSTRHRRPSVGDSDSESYISQSDLGSESTSSKSTVMPNRSYLSHNAGYTGYPLSFAHPGASQYPYGVPMGDSQAHSSSAGHSSYGGYRPGGGAHNFRY